MSILSSSVAKKVVGASFLTLSVFSNAYAERLWSRSHTDWTPKTVSIGLRGTQVFGPVEFGQDHVSLYSGFSPAVAVPVWTQNLPVAGTNMESDSAEETDIHVALSQVVQNNNNSTRITVVTAFNSQSSTPLWSHSFPGITSGLGKIGISRDGDRIVAAVVYPSEMRLAVAIFSPNSGTPVSTFNITNFGLHLKGFNLSADGSTLYLTSNGMLRIYNLADNSLVHQTVLPGMYEGHALCGNGRAFAWGEFNRVRLYEKNTNGTYTQTWSREITGSIVADRIALSDDCSTMAYGFHDYSQNLRFIVEAVDVQSKQILMHDECTGTGTFQNIISDIDISADGSRFAVGSWGDEGNVCSDLRVYDRQTDTPIYQYLYPGSVYGLDMSADGRRVATAVKPVHANTFAGGGSFELHAPEMDELRLVGIPRPGATMTVTLREMPGNSPTRLLTSSSILQDPVYMGSMGYLYLPRLNVSPVAFSNTNAQGLATGTFQLPAGTPGQNLFMQAIALLPRRLTENFEQIRLLP